MPTLQQLEAALTELNEKYPRFGIPRLEISAPYNLVRDWGPGSKWPSSDFPGVYLMFDEQGELAYIGKASCDQAIGSRLGSGYFKYGDSGEAVLKRLDWQNERICEVRTIGLPRDHGFEAAAIEEFLLNRLAPRLNRNGCSRSAVEIVAVASS